VQPTLIPEVKQAVYQLRHNHTFKYPEVAPPIEPDQAEERAYIEKGLKDTRYRGVKQATIKAQGAHKAEEKVRNELPAIYSSLVVERHELPSTSTTGPGTLSDEDEEMGEPLD
jgi:hypothetical protein